MLCFCFLDIRRCDFSGTFSTFPFLLLNRLAIGLAGV